MKESNYPPLQISAVYKAVHFLYETIQAVGRNVLIFLLGPGLKWKKQNVSITDNAHKPNDSRKIVFFYIYMKSILCIHCIV
jgi:hypothetical protein